MRPFKSRPRRETGGDVMRQVIAACKMFGIDVRRRNTGAAMLPGRNGAKQLVRFGNAGDPDLEAILPPTGRAFAVETKATKELPTVAQFNRILEINKAGGFAFWCDCVDLALQVLPYAVPDRRIAYTSATQIHVVGINDVVEGEIFRWEGTKKMKRGKGKSVA